MPEQFNATYLPYSEIGNFSKIVLDYVNGAEDLKAFYEHPVNVDGIKASIEKRKQYKTNRSLLTAQLEKQYTNAENSEQVRANIAKLSEETTFTVCTAHQPNIFTGHLYFIYKILHTIKLAAVLTEQLPQYNFVPVFFMGSEDADLDELNHVVIDNKKYTWQTNQKGAVGRMVVDDKLVKLIDEISGRVSVEEYGNEIIDVLKKCFTKNIKIEEATFQLVHYLFKQYGLIVFLPDNAAFKKEMLSIFEDDIFNNTPSEIVEKSSQKLDKKYKVQAHPREINLFYLKDNIRNRIVQVKDKFVVHDTDIIFTKDELKVELDQYPERFSPNVILRGLFQEIILPNIAFIGGGGELAYWLELKDLFAHYKTPFPLLILRNSFLVIEKKQQELLAKLRLAISELFAGEEQLLNKIVKAETENQLDLEQEKIALYHFYSGIKSKVNKIDSTLGEHTSALESVAMKRINNLEKKMLRVEKRKFSDSKNQLEKLFSILFPGSNLQERTENFMLLYAKWGSTFFETLYDNSLTLEQEFCVIEEKA